MAGLFGRSDEHAILHDTLRRFMRDQSGLEQRRRGLEARPPDRLALWHSLAELGALGAAVSEALGGFGGAPHDMAVVQDALAPSLAVEPVLAAAISARLLSHLDLDDAASLSTALISGERIFVLAHAEGFDPFAPPAATASPTGSTYRLRARKPCVRHADVATDLLITATLVFGRPIGQNQGIQHPLAECWTKLEAAWWMTLRAAWLYDQGLSCGAEANAAKFLAAQAAFDTATRAVLTHGGMGYAKDYQVERLFRESILPRIAPVTEQLILSFIAEKVLGMPKSY